MNSDFPRIITFLRKERGLSQKQVATDLGISQALLSHYEKGIRECGLDFLVKAAEYFEVSCDYLLGRTVQRRLASVSADEIPESDEIRHLKGNMINQINKKLLMNTTTVIFDLLAQIGNKKLTNAVSNYLMCSEYLIFRTIYCSEEHNSQTMFSVDRNRYKNLTSASMLIDLEIIDTLIENNDLSLTLSPDVISSYFEKGASSLFNLIQYSERNIKNISNLKTSV
ncbi:MAG: helix-turn-helix transcriptional regulator [Ruminococcus sp.]|nr:helix-turn-helix transcriptional regulator [Ruminococcus sp.]